MRHIASPDNRTKEAEIMVKKNMKKTYEKPSLVKYGSVYGMTKGHFKVFGPGDGLILINDDGDVIGTIGDAPSSFH